MSNDLLITISRQFGSGGHAIAEALAQALDLPLFDKDTIAQASKEYGLYERVMQEDHPSPTNSLLFSIATNMYHLNRDSISFEQRASMAEEKTMRNLAKEGSCIFLGRAADAVFADAPGRISFFLHAPLEWRIDRTAQQYHLSAQKAKNIVRQMDRKRAAYYADRSDGNWGSAETYHLSIDTSLLGVDGTAAQLLAFIRSCQQK